MPKSFRVLFLGFSIVVGLFVAFSLGLRLGQGRVITPTANSLESVNEVWDVLNQEYVDPRVLDPQKFSTEAIKGLLKALNDPYTAYLEPHLYSMELSNLGGKFQGIGAQVTMRDGEVVVIAPIPGSPAEKAGVRPGDKILAVDGMSISGLSLNEAVLKIRGPKGTPITLRLLHEKAEEAVEVTIVRDEIPLTSAHYEIKDGVGYLHISHFDEETPEQVAGALRELTAKGIKGLVLDLRNNPGGLLQAVVEVTSQFVAEGVALYEVDREGEKTPWSVKPGGLATSLPLVVLVNSHSASGSEILAGALQDYQRAPLIGTKTFGKGSVNVLRPLRGGAALYVTRARWLTPQGRPIEGQGLLPDIEIQVTAEDQAQGRDPQLERAMAYIQERLSP